MTETKRCLSYPYVVDAYARVMEAWGKDDDLELASRMRQWCCRNVPNDDWLHDINYKFEFRHLEDAIRFRLTWL